ncbi:FAD-dependent oxidoreductase [Microbacterium sp. CFH 31415]|uniref:oxidoreductase n=1 Tax=Microbacterium sp. CFH 31415 TaxID=2921732 RepID=UPI001F131EF2|nr:FAD-dependent oxidoreductase [Microbacterium sp. CFH 31415]MCH6231640.1 FAD-dependent oxidoreductase [Microbacterium sp. CFH 31415]
MTATTPALTRLFTPIDVGPMRVRNRVVSTAHLTNFAADGLPTVRHREYWRAKARGGVGLIITEGSLVHPSSRTPDTKFIELWRDEVVGPLREIGAAVRAEGAALVAQLNHMGVGWTASPWMRPNGMRAHGMTRVEIDEVVAGFAAAARRIREAGLDGIEIHAAHGYPIEQFLSPLTNRRSDEYGGSEAARMRMLIDVIRAVRLAAGPDLAVGIRVGGDQFTPGGLDLDDMRRIVPEVLAQAPVDFVNVSFYRNHRFGPGGNSIVPMYVPEGRFVDLAQGIKEVVDVPVFCVNRIVDPRMAEEILTAGQADMVAMTRAHIADPELSRKAAEGRFDEIRPCIGVNEGCLGQVMSGAASPLTCAVNPSAGHEHERVDPAGVSLAVAVIGGGMAGMELARVAAGRGHRVRLFESEDRLGGQLALAARIPGLKDMGRPVAYYERQFELLGVTIELSRRVGQDDLAAIGADVIVVATGSRGADWAETGLSREPRLPWLTARDAFDAGRPGHRILIYATDQTMEPLGLADRLATDGAQVALATPAPGLGALVENVTRPFILDRLTRNGVELAILSRLQTTAEATLLVRGDRGDHDVDVASEYDLLVVAGGAVAVDDLGCAPAGGRPVHVIGDAFAPRKLVAATQQAWELGRTL